MGSHIETIFLYNLLLYILDLRQRNLINLSALTANKMIVLDIVHSLLVGVALVKPMLYQKTCIYKNINIILQGCKDYMIVLFLHRLVQGFNVEMPRIGIYLVEDGKTLRRLTHRIAFQIVL